MRHAPDNIEPSSEALRKLQSELRASERQLKLVIGRLERHQAQLAAHESSIARLDRILMELITGRVWRTLRAAGKLAKRFLPGRSDAQDSMVLDRSQRSFLVCDEPSTKDLQLRSGTISIRGWCLAEKGVDHVLIEVPGLTPIQAVPAVARPDIKKAHPDIDLNGRSGFIAEFDSSLLPGGHYEIRLKLISQGRAIRETTIPLDIDHQHGFSSEYARWIEEFEQPDEEFIALKLPSFLSRPKFSILMPVFNTNPKELAAAIESVLAQSYENYELCIADDCSSLSETVAVLDQYGNDKRIRIVRGQERGGISRATNAAWDSATGDYICFLDHDDVLSPNALAWVCELLDREPEADLIYSDEDKLDVANKRLNPFFKPEWSPDLLLSENYICHFLILRRDLAEASGRLDPAFDGSQDYDLILRATERARHIRHVPRVLYHWRAGQDSTALSLDNKDYALEAARKALMAHAARGKAGMTIESGLIKGRWRARYPIPEGTRVSIVIPSGGKLDVLRTNLSSLFKGTRYPDYEVVVIDNSKHGAIEKYLDEVKQEHANVRYLDWRNKPFNFSQISNAAARTCDSPLLLFLNDDTSAIEPGWLEAMVELAMRPEVGAVGAKLLYPNDLIQHAGVIMGLFDNCGHAFKMMDAAVEHYFDFPDVIRNVSAVTGACLMTRAEVFWEAGGFDEQQFAVAFNDIDLSLKIGKQGYRVLYTPHARLYHHEAFSKTLKDLVPHPEEVEAMRMKWRAVIESDPYYSPNLTRNEENYSLRTLG